MLPKPVLSSITPTVGPAGGGTLVTLSGANFLGATKVAFGASASSSFTVENDTRLTALAPARPAGVAAIKVTTPGGTSAAVTAGKFTYVGVPVVKTVSPKVLPPAGGTLITVTGAGFTGVSSVAVDGTPATAVSIVSATKLTAVAPPHVIGAVAVAVVGPAGASAPSAAATLTYANAATLTSIVPISGPAAGGNPVTLTGSGFTGTSVVKFASTVAPSFTVVDDSTIVATTPPRAAGTTAIAVTTPMGKAVATPTAKYTFVTAPTVTSLVRGSGLATGGSTVTITGTGFTGASSVTFGGVAAPFTLVNTKTIIATTPAHSAGEVDVRVATPGGPNPVGPASRFWYFPIDGRAPEGRTSLFMGQELGAVGGLTGYDQGYADYVGSPAGVTIYTDLRYPCSLRQPLDLGAGVLCGSCYLNSRRFDRSAIAVGLYMVDELPAIVSGSYDANIDSLADWIKEADRPVFLRIGYEFDGSWNHYDPAQYVQAFRRIMDRLDARGADNAISVWQSAGTTATTSTLMQWYPGDDYVDWVAYSYFNQSNPGMTSLAVARSARSRR